MLDALHGKKLVGDFSLNTANSLTAQSYLALGLERITPTPRPECRTNRRARPRRGPGPDRSRRLSSLPVFHTEHCVFCRFLSTGTSYKDCGRPCEKHRVELKDSAGRAHPVMGRHRLPQHRLRSRSPGKRAPISNTARRRRPSFPSGIRARVIGTRSSVFTGRSNRLSTEPPACRSWRGAKEDRTTRHHRSSLFVAKNYLELPILQ